jgi:hypothetical protein
VKYSPSRVAASRGLKLCHKCRTEKPIDAFPFVKAAQKSRSPCYDCRHRARRAWIKKKRAAAAPYVHPRAWSADDSEGLRLLIVAGFSSRECAELLGRTVGSVHDHRIKRSYPKFMPGRSRPPAKWMPARLALLAEMRARGDNVSQCAHALKTTRGSVAHAIARYLKEDKPNAKPLPDVRPANRAARTVSLPSV